MPHGHGQRLSNHKNSLRPVPGLMPEPVTISLTERWALNLRADPQPFYADVDRVRLKRLFGAQPLPVAEYLDLHVPVAGPRFDP